MVKCYISSYVTFFQFETIVYALSLGSKTATAEELVDEVLDTNLSATNATKTGNVYSFSGDDAFGMSSGIVLDTATSSSPNDPDLAKLMDYSYDGDNLVSSDEYRVTYENNTNPGIATITVTDASGGNYVVHATKTFKIVVETLDMNNTTKTFENYGDSLIMDSDDELFDKIDMTDEELESLNFGSKLNVYLVVNLIEEDQALDDLQLIQKKIGNKANIGALLDVSLFKQINDNEPIKINSTKKKIKIKTTLPDELLNNDEDVTRVFKLMRVHDDKVEEIKMNMEGQEITFETDKFSTYAIAYKDTVHKANQPLNIANHKTGTQINTYVVMAIFSIVLIAGILIYCLQTKNNKKMINNYGVSFVIRFTFYNLYYIIVL